MTLTNTGGKIARWHPALDSNDTLRGKEIYLKRGNERRWPVILILYRLLFVFRKHQKRPYPPYVRINHEGIFASRDSLLIEWAEIKELSPATFLGTPYLRIVPWNLAEIASRAKRSSGRFLRLGIHLTLLLFGHTKSPAPIGIFQMALPVSIDELLAAIQEHFAPELLEHRVMVRRSQP